MPKELETEKEIMNSYQSSSELLLITSENGLEAEGEVTIRGFSTSNSEQIEWYINDTINPEILHTSADVSTTESVIIRINITNPGKWDWELTIDFSQYEDCSCIFEITQTYENGEHSQSKIGIFIGEIQLNQGPILLMDQIGWMSGESFNITGIIIDDMHEENTTFDFSICKIGYCDSVGIPIVLETIENISFTQINGKISSFEIEVKLENIIHFQDTIIIEDGEWMITGSADNENATGGHDHIYLWVNNIKPIANISAFEYVVESSSKILVDASHSNDYFWGRELLKYDWKIEENGVTRAPMASEIFEENILHISAEKNGTINITLTVRDATGLANTTIHKITIANSKPIAVMSIDGKYVNNNEIVVLGKNQTWPLQSLSTDTPNDIQTLQHSWYYEGVLVAEGEYSELTSEFLYKNTEQKLTLKITDNDGAEDIITVWITSEDNLNSAKSENLSTQNIISIATLAVLFIVAGIITYKKYTSKKIYLPKWKK